MDLSLPYLPKPLYQGLAYTIFVFKKTIFFICILFINNIKLNSI